MVIAELPGSVQQLEPLGGFPVFHKGVIAAGIRDKIGTVWHGVYMQNVWVFVILWDNHGGPPVI